MMKIIKFEQKAASFFNLIHHISGAIVNKCYSNLIIYQQGTFNCGILVSGVGGSGDPRRKWEEMGEGEREKSVAFVCKMI